MNEPKTRCANCGTRILTRTAEKNFGLCAPCHSKARTTPPDAFEMPHELVQRMASMGLDPQKFRQDVWRDGPASVNGFLDDLDATAAECRVWAPALRAFAIECRQRSPVPRVESLTPLARAQYGILRAGMRDFADSPDGLMTLAPSPYRLAVLSTNQAGLAAAEEFFGRSGAVIVEEAERRYWFEEVYQERKDALWWYSFAWWTIRDGVDAHQMERFGGRVPASPKEAYWIVDSGVQWGPLAGGGRQELWRWDGAQAEFIETGEQYMF